MNYHHVILGGTFDHFHVGHQKLIDSAFSQSEKVTIGIAQPKLYQHKFLSEIIENYQIREQNLLAYLQKKNFYSRTTIIPITDIYGTTLVDSTIEAIFVTEENLPNVALINKKRIEKGLVSLETEVVPFVKDGYGEIITSERIRRGEINREGFVYKSLFTKKTLLMPEKLRTQLQKPIGQLFTTIDEMKNMVGSTTMIVSVGDIVTASLHEHNLSPVVTIIDFRTRRQKIAKQFYPHAFSTYNKPGTINKDAVGLLQKALIVYLKSNTSQILVVSGEEDLLALPALLLAPLDAVVVYGQYREGIVANRVTEALKKKIVKLIEQFS